MSKRLEMEVWSLDKCAGCGLCVAACSKQMLQWEDQSHPVLKQRTKSLGLTRVQLDGCSFCQKFCEEVCPRLEHWSEINPIATLAARARGPIQAGTPNDVIRSILVAARSAGLIDGVVMLDLNPWDLKPVARVATSVEDIVDSMGPQYLWAPVFDALNEALFSRKMKSIAVVSTPCSAQAIRKLRSSENPRLKPYQDAIRLSVSIFCTGMYHPALIDDIVLKQMDLSREKIKRIEVSPDKDWLHIIQWDGSVLTVPRQESEAYTRPGCASCTDYLGESADLGIGKVGAPEGASSLIIRSRAGDIFVRNAIQMNLLETSHNVDLKVLQQAAEEKERRERAQSFQDLQILMLDALSDPLQHNEAIKQFVRMYRTPNATGAPEKITNGCTGC
jgi:coenzyme F420 hydrogenase subunit beta